MNWVELLATPGKICNLVCVCVSVIYFRSTFVKCLEIPLSGQNEKDLLEIQWCDEHGAVLQKQVSCKVKQRGLFLETSVM